MTNYQQYLSDILHHGAPRKDRTGVGTIALFGKQLAWDLSAGFPLVTTKNVYFHAVVVELLWFLSGSTNIRPLLKEGVHIWTDWPLKRYNDFREKTARFPVAAEVFEARVLEDELFAEQWGDLGPVYGKQWRDFGGVDQIEALIQGLRTNPYSRRHLVSAWNPPAIPEQALPPCHYAFQCYVEDGRLSLMWQQRSVDSFLGLPFNIASYALLLHILAQQTDLEVGRLIFSGGDCHIYKSHMTQVEEQLARKPRPLPTLDLRWKGAFDKYKPRDVHVLDYNPHPALPAPIAV